jgi:hypothetical protein
MLSLSQQFSVDMKMHMPVKTQFDDSLLEHNQQQCYEQIQIKKRCEYFSESASHFIHLHSNNHCILNLRLIVHIYQSFCYSTEILKNSENPSQFSDFTEIPQLRL